MNYKDLEIWRIANEIVIQIHHMTINDLPKFELYETGSQIRRSSKSVKSNIVEGFGRRKSKPEFIHYLSMALSSNDETIDHLETLYYTKSLNDDQKFETLKEQLIELGKKLNLFLCSVRKNHKPFKGY